MLLFLDLYTIIIDIFIHDDLSFVRAEEKYCLTNNLFFKTNQYTGFLNIPSPSSHILSLLSLSLRPTKVLSLLPLSVLSFLPLSILPSSFIFTPSLRPTKVLSLLPISVLPKFYLYSLFPSYHSSLFLISTSFFLPYSFTNYC